VWCISLERSSRRGVVLSDNGTGSDNSGLIVVQGVAEGGSMRIPDGMVR